MACLIIQALSPLCLYWKSIFIIFYPILLLPVFLSNNIAAMRCLYVVLLMAGFWVLEVVPAAVTGLLPVIFFPFMGILDTKNTCMCYFKESNMMFAGGMIIALAIEFCNLHTRISLHSIKLIGCSYRRLNLGLVTITMLVSMWISNSAATAMMLPIIRALLEELEAQGLSKMWESEDDDDEEEATKRPTSVTMCFYVSTAYAATIGGMGCVVGSGTNLVLKGIYESDFKNSTGVEFNKWLGVNIPLMLAIMYPTWVWMQFWYLGLCRPKSADAKAIDVGEEGKKVVKQVLGDKLKEMGACSTHQILVGVMFVLGVLLWLLRRPGFMAGWPEWITETAVADATAAMIVVILLFVFPSRCECLTTVPPKLLTWQYVERNLPWSLIFLIGGGFAIAEGMKASGLGDLIANELKEFAEFPPLAILVISCLAAMIVTQFTSNAAVANILLPMVSNLARTAKIHPMYLMMPVCLACSFSFCLPVSTPPNAMVALICNMRTSEMIKVGVVVEIISLVMLVGVFSLLGPLIWDFDSFPDWARKE